MDGGFSFERLKVYKVARELVKSIYLLQNQFPQHERYDERVESFCFSRSKPSWYAGRGYAVLRQELPKEREYGTLSCTENG